MFWCFGPEVCGILAPQPGIKPVPSSLEGEVSATELPGKSLCGFFLGSFLMILIKKID